MNEKKKKKKKININQINKNNIKILFTFAPQYWIVRPKSWSANNWNVINSLLILTLIIGLSICHPSKSTLINYNLFITIIIIIIINLKWI